jgi:hypothetical protein
MPEKCIFPKGFATHTVLAGVYWAHQGFLGFYISTDIGMFFKEPFPIFRALSRVTSRLVIGQGVRIIIRVTAF